jgi:hypothetical protein
MLEDTLHIPTAAGAMVFMPMDAPGIRDELRALWNGSKGCPVARGYA